MPGKYLMVLPVPGYRTGGNSFATEGPFVDHLKMLKDALGDTADVLTIVAPEMNAEQYAELKPQLKELTESHDRIRFCPVFPDTTGRAQYWLMLPKVMRTLAAEVRQADVVHAGISELFRPFEFVALMLAHKYGKRTVCVTDIDNRLTPKMKRAIGEWSARQYWWTKLVHQNAAHFQQRFAAGHFSLVLLKGQALAKDYGAGRSNVRFFLDSAFSAQHIIPEARLQEKLSALKQGPLRVVYFGRLVPYKGVDRMLHALRRALDLGAQVHLEVIGTGPSEADLRALCQQLRLQDDVSFVGSVPFGPALFERLYDTHVLLAAPLSQDTPRSALDAAAAGVSIIAFDTYYYKELNALGAPVTVVPWPDASAMGDALAACSRDRIAVGEQAKQAVTFSRDNTQEAWLERRVSWTQQAAAGSS